MNPMKLDVPVSSTVNAPVVVDDPTPASIMMAGTVQTIPFKHRMLKCLFDSGSKNTLIAKNCLPTGTILDELPNQVYAQTTMGTYRVRHKVNLKNIRFPEFNSSRTVDEVDAMIMTNPCRYDVIVGRGLMIKCGIDILLSTKEVAWEDDRIPFRDVNTTLQEVMDSLYVEYEDRGIALDTFAVEILEAKYEKANLDEIADAQTQLTQEQRDVLRALLKKHEALFSGNLGRYPHKQFHIDVDPTVQPTHSRYYPIARVHLEAFRKELLHLIEIGVLSPQGSSRWCSPTFVKPKKDGRIRWLSDLRALNKAVIRKQYRIPIIEEVLSRRKGYKFLTCLDISMQYYCFELDDESKELCTIATPFGYFKYNRLPMGLSCSPDWAQETMENILKCIDDIEIYIDDIGLFSPDWESHIKTLDEVLYRLRTNGLTVNPLKCKFAIKECEWLGYWLTPTGLKPYNKKISAITKMQRPQNVKQLRAFIGAVNFYRHMWPGRARILAPLTAQVGKKKLMWTDEMDLAFQQMKALMAQDVLLSYPDHNQDFQVIADASDYAVGSVVMQNNKPVAYFSRKLNSAQRNYTTMEKELLAIVLTFQEFRSMLLGAKIHVYTDHHNLTQSKLSSQRVLRWRLYLEEYGPTFHYIKGPDNVIADPLSRLPRDDSEDPPFPDDPLQNFDNFYWHGHYEDNFFVRDSLFTALPRLEDDAWEESDAKEDAEDCFFSLTDDKDMLDCFLNLPYEHPIEQNPLNLEAIHLYQQADQDLQDRRARRPHNYPTRVLSTDVQPIITYVHPHHNPDTQWRIALPSIMIQPTIEWFHQVLNHPGRDRMIDTIMARYHHPQLRGAINQFTCQVCQQNKSQGIGYGYLPEPEVRLLPWTEVAVDMIGPWSFNVGNTTYCFRALTCIDPCTALTELIRTDPDHPTAEHIRDKFEQAWLCRYPLPERCIHDQGGEFTGFAFQRLLQQLQIHDVPSSSKNPQSNAIVERMHQTVGNLLRTMIYSNPPQNVQQANDMVDAALATASHALRASVSASRQSTPGALVFNRDMFLNVPLIADFYALRGRRELLIQETARRGNLKRRHYDYVIGQQVWKKLYRPNKLGQRATGPHNIIQVHTNGTLTIQLNQGVTERINIRRLYPAR